MARTLVVTRGGGLWAIDRETLAERRIVEFAGAELGECSHRPRWRVADGGVSSGRAQCGLVAGRFDGSAWREIPFPRTVIHPQFHPLEPEWIEFAGDPAPRMHRVRRDGSGMECLYEHGNDEFLVHETFLGATGDMVFTVWPRALRRMDWTTREMRTIVEYNAWHIAPDRAGERVLCDTNHPDEGLQIIDVATGGRRQAVRQRVEQSGLAVAEELLRGGRGFRGRAEESELDGERGGHGVRSAAHAPAPVVVVRGGPGGLRERSDGGDAGVFDAETQRRGGKNQEGFLRVRARVDDQYSCGWILRIQMFLKRTGCEWSWSERGSSGACAVYLAFWRQMVVPSCSLWFWTSTPL